MRTDIAQAIHDAAVSEWLCYIAEIESHILVRVFLSNSEFWEISAKHFSVPAWFRSFEGRTYMLLVAEALS